jgi:hypothetical protein
LLNVLQVYFCILLYSYSYHLRHNSYRSLPLSKPNIPVQPIPDSPTLSAIDHDHVESYHLPLANGIGSTPISARASSSRHTPMLSGASFTEFVGAHTSRDNGWPIHHEEDEVVFDSDAVVTGESSKGRASGDRTR